MLSIHRHSPSISSFETDTNAREAIVGCRKLPGCAKSSNPHNLLAGNNDGPMSSTPEYYLMFLKEGFDFDGEPLSNLLQLIARLPVPHC